MRRCAKALQIGIVLVISAMALVGCGRRERLDRKAASEIVVFQMDNQTTQRPAITPAPFTSASKTESNASANIAATPTATQKTAAKTATGNTAPDADITQLMDDLLDTLNELDASITAADRDTLTDSVLIALAK